MKEMGRILNNKEHYFLSVDLGGEPTPDEPTVFSVESLEALLLQEQFEIMILSATNSLTAGGAIAACASWHGRNHKIRLSSIIKKSSGAIQPGFH
jgi:hypothetical protein